MIAKFLKRRQLLLYMWRGLWRPTCMFSRMQISKFAAICSPPFAIVQCSQPLALGCPPPPRLSYGHAVYIYCNIHNSLIPIVPGGCLRLKPQVPWMNESWPPNISHQLIKLNVYSGMEWNVELINCGHTDIDHSRRPDLNFVIQ
jgi:hypothetical protein